MKTIHKFPLSFGAIEINQGAKIIHTAAQNDKICVWAIVDTDKPLVLRKVYIIGTGWDFARGDVKEECYVGTVHEDEFIWHIFDEGEQ